MASIYKARYTYQGQTRQTAKWYIKYRGFDGVLRRVPGFTSRAQTAALARDLEGRRRPLSDSLGDYARFLRSKGDTDKHIKLATARLRAFDLDNLSGAAAVRALPANRQTALHYARTLGAFVRWAMREGLLTANPVTNVQVSLKSYRPTFMRRSATQEEISALLRPTKSPWRGLTAPDRGMLYKTALNTGFRAAELAKITPNSLADGHLILDPSDTKNNKRATQPLSAPFEAVFSGYAEGKPRNKPVWPGSWYQRSAEMLHRDLDTDIDFHSLRVTYITELVRLGLHPKKVQILARHSTINLTMNYYTRLTPSDIDISGLWQ